MPEAGQTLVFVKMHGRFASRHQPLTPQVLPDCGAASLAMVLGYHGKHVPLDRVRGALAVSRDGVTVTFSRDERGKAGLCVLGNGQSEEELRAAGEELSRRVVQQYVYQRLTQEMQSRGYMVVEETTDVNQAIHMRIRHWEN